MALARNLFEIDRQWQEQDIPGPPPFAVLCMLLCRGGIESMACLEHRGRLAPGCLNFMQG